MDEEVAIKQNGRYYKMKALDCELGCGCYTCDLNPTVRSVGKCEYDKMCLALAEWTGYVSSQYGWCWEEVKP